MARSSEAVLRIELIINDNCFTQIHTYKAKHQTNALIQNSNRLFQAGEDQAKALILRHA